MREIKFRGYTEDDPNEGWVRGDLVLCQGYPVIVNSYCDQFTCEEESIGQYTGLRDKNGIEIWEGDIVRGRIYHMFAEDNVIFQIRWTDQEKGYGMHWYPNEVEVIGNIFENPELLEE